MKSYIAFIIGGVLTAFILYIIFFFIAGDTDTEIWLSTSLIIASISGFSTWIVNTIKKNK